MAYSIGPNALMTNQTVSGTVSDVFVMAGVSEAVLTITVSNATLTSGTVQIEASDVENYSGTWQRLVTITEAAVTPSGPNDTVLAQDSKITVSIPGSYLYVRARLTATIVGGATISVSGYGVR